MNILIEYGKLDKSFVWGTVKASYPAVLLQSDACSFCRLFLHSLLDFFKIMLSPL